MNVPFAPHSSLSQFVPPKEWRKNMFLVQTFTL